MNETLDSFLICDQCKSKVNHLSGHEGRMICDNCDDFNDRLWLVAAPFLCGTGAGLAIAAIILVIK